MKQVFLPVMVLSLTLLTSCATRERKGTAASGGQQQFSAQQLKQQISQENVRSLTAEWPETSRQATEKMLEKYGLPDGMTENLLTWNDAGHFKRIFVHREEITHNFPVEHKDVLHQFVSYEIPLGKADDVLRYTGSVLLDRTAGEMSARCDREEMNVLALNIADQVLQGRMSPEEARMEYGKGAQALMQGESTRFTSGLVFSQPENSANPDEPLIQAEEARPVGETDEGVPMQMETAPTSDESLELQGDTFEDVEEN
jgi:hypothetical protein